MKPQFEISFDFPVAHSNVKVTLRATVELHHSDPYYVVHDFNYGTRDHKDHVSILPRQEIKFIKKGNTSHWVHCDSERESLLSIAIGKAIQETLGDDVQMASH